MTQKLNNSNKLSNKLIFIFSRFGHTMVMDKVTLKDPALFNISQFPLHENFFNPNLYHSENGQGFVKTLLGIFFPLYSYFKIHHFLIL